MSDRSWCDGCCRQSPKVHTSDPFTLMCDWCGHLIGQRKPSARQAGLWLELSQPAGDRTAVPE